MRKLSSKIISIILVMCMVLPIVPTWALAIDEEEESGVVFQLEKTEETPESVTLKISMTHGKVLCFDLEVEADEDLTCTAITVSSEVKTFFIENADGSIASNPETGKISFANKNDLPAPAEIAVLTYSKADIKGITADDFNLKVSSCYQTGEDGSDFRPEVYVFNSLPEEHSHVPSGVIVETKAPTCMEAGEGVMYCKECGDVAVRMEIEKKEHTVAEEKVDATCEQDGYVRTYCTACNTELSNKVLPKINHANAYADHKEPTCTEDGYDRIHCPDCGMNFDETIISATNHPNKEHQHKDVTCTEDGYDRDYCPDCEEYLNEVVIPATNHSNTEVVRKDATCTEDGYERVVCKDCGMVISEKVIKADGHKIITEHKDATCTEDGYHKEYCSKCDEVFKDETYPMTGHQHTKKVITDATCTEDGSIQEICEDCGKVIKTTVLTAEGHKLVNDMKNATCTEDGYIDIKCSKCGHVESHTLLKKTGHSWTDWQVVKEPTYSTVGIERQVCRNCGESHERDIPMIVVPVERIVITPDTDFTLNVKKKDKLQADVYPEEAAYSAEIIFESSDPSIVSVDNEGNITAKKKGTATITARTADGSVSDSINITVNYSTIQWIIIYILFGWIWYL